MKLRFSSIVALLLLTGLFSIQAETTSQLPQDDDKDFLFLAAEEPDSGADIPDEDEVLVAPSKKVDVKSQKADVPAESLPAQYSIDLMPTHQKLEDVDRQKLAPVLSIKKANGEFTLSGKYKPEGFYAKNATLLNNCNEFDQVFFVRHTMDINGDARCGKDVSGYDTAQLKFTLRNKGVWGNPASIIPTTDASVREIDATFGAHRHSIARHLVWFRELWLKTSLNAVFRHETETKHFFTLGFFPFSLGHGIALGDAFATNPGFLGFYSEDVVDQYAPGFLFSGELVKNKLAYGLYGAILENRSDSVTGNLEKIYAQECGRRLCPARGFGHVNWLIAAHLEAVAFDDKQIGKMELEPYILCNFVPEQKIEFPGDAKSKLATIGLDVEYQRGNFAISVEAAKNFGKQQVHCWDRNQIISKLDPTTAAVLHVDSHVTDTKTKTKFNALDIEENQEAINKSADSLNNCTNAEQLNGQIIPGTDLKNKDDRFSNAFENKFTGWMVFADAGYWWFDKQLQLAFMVGAASGDENPNEDFKNPKLAPKDGTYDGFIGLQEIFSGERVESAFAFSRLPRPLSLPDDAIERGFFAKKTSGFTNLVFFGSGLHVKPDWQSKFYWRPNVIFVWQEEATRAFDLATKKVSKNCFARNFLGTEVNSFIDVYPLDCLKAYFIAAIFIPGGHFEDIKGTPLNADQLEIIKAIDDTVTTGRLSRKGLLGDDIAWTLNIGLEYKF